MNVIFSALILVIAIFWAMITTVAGLIVIPIILLLSVLFPISKATKGKDSYTEVIPDHHVHVTIDTVPPMYYQEYSKYLKSPEWRAFRRLVLKRDKYTCVDCAVRGYNKDYNPNGPLLQVHHIHYDGIETMTFTIDQCVSVCPECHDKRHGR